MHDNLPTEPAKNNLSGKLEDAQLSIKIIGVGGAGNNAADRLKLDNLDQVDLAVLNTDSKTLNASPISERLMLGRSVTRGLSTGGEAELGRQAAEADREGIQRMVAGTDLVFLLAGLGGGTGSGATPVVADVAVETGAVVVAFVTMPFSREGQRRFKQAEDSLSLLRQSCHAVIPLPNDLLLQQIEEDATLLDAFSIADDWIYRGVRGIVSMLLSHGLINVDFANLRTAFAHRGGKTLFGLASAEGPDVVKKVLKELDVCPLLHLPENKYIRKTDSLIVNITGGPDLSMAMVHEILDAVTERFSSRENTVIGAVIDGTLRNKLNLCVIGATDLGPRAHRAPPRYQYKPVPPATRPHSVDEPKPDAKGEPASTAPVDTENQRAQTEAFSAQEFAYPEEATAKSQEEFEFAVAEERRGVFEDTDANLYEGADLDIPTYLRRGIKISL